MANKTNTTYKSKAGKEYDRYRFTKTVEDYDKKTGSFIIKKKQFVGKNKKEAEQKLDNHKEYIQALKAELSKTTKEKMAERLFGESVKGFIDNTFMPDSSIKDSTKLRYINSYHNIFDNKSILNKPVKDVCGEDIQAVITESQNAPSSKEAALKLIRNFYKYAAAQLIAHDVTQGIIIPQAAQKRQDQSIVVYTKNELDAFLEYTPADHCLRFLIVLAIETGCRIGELLALTYSDFDLENEQIIINKSLSEVAAIKDSGRKLSNEITTTKSLDSVRSMPITPLIKKEFYEHMIRTGKRTGNIFTNKSGELCYASNMRVSLKRLCDKINKDYNKANKKNADDKDAVIIEHKGWHAFRHTYGSDLAAAGVPIQEVCKLMGHSDISVTAKYYVNVTSDQKRIAANMLNEYRRPNAVCAN